MTALLTPGDTYCRDCGSVIHLRAEVCPKCGIRQKAVAVNSRNRSTAGVFALFFGGLGVHKFYLGQPGLGIFYLFFCWTFIPAFVGFIEALVLLTMSDDAFNAKYNNA
jgi:TM2 domain-containing membrane protein YozV